MSTDRHAIGPGCISRYLAQEAEKRPEKATVRARRHKMNKWEESFSHVLQARWQAGEIFKWEFEVCKFNIGDGAWYTPDFRVVKHNNEVEFFEIKGHKTAASIVRIKAAAKQFPEY